MDDRHTPDPDPSQRGPAPDFWLGSRTEAWVTDYDGSVRRCWTVKRVRTEWREHVLLVEVDPLLPGQAEGGLVTLSRRRPEDSWDEVSDRWVAVLVGLVSREVAARLRAGETSVPVADITPLMQGEIAAAPHLLPPTQEERWEEGFGKLRQFVAREGHARVPELHVEDGYNLGLWVDSQRFKRANDYLPDAQASLLEALPGWQW